MNNQFMKYALKELKNNRQTLKLLVVKEFTQWLDQILPLDLQSMALAKMVAGEQEHGPISEVVKIEKEISEERLDLILWTLMRNYQKKSSTELSMFGRKVQNG